tara:strand:+ start:617 stop:1474 length:858 start_codon:yes stop_codon:yes gene_type:complete
MENANKKVAPMFCCKKCDYITSKKSSWKKHIETQKHKKQLFGEKCYKKVSQPFLCEKCQKSYTHATSLCRHKKRGCQSITTTKKQNINNELKDMQYMMKSMIKQQTETQKQINNLNMNTGTTNNMTINVFLNEYCKNAMNMTEFIEQLQLSMDDLFYTRDYGYVKGISNILVKNLQDMKPNERPIHCSDKKRLQFYIKEENKWEKDKDNQINKSITAIRHKQIKQIKEWEKEHPRWNTNDEETELYAQMVQQVMASTDNEKNKENIKKEISDKVDVKDIKNNIVL